MAGPGDMARGTAGGARYAAAGIGTGLCSGAGAGGGLPSSIEATPMDARLLAACARGQGVRRACWTDVTGRLVSRRCLYPHMHVHSATKPDLSTTLPCAPSPPKAPHTTSAVPGGTCSEVMPCALV